MEEQGDRDGSVIRGSGMLGRQLAQPWSSREVLQKERRAKKGKKREEKGEGEDQQEKRRTGTTETPRGE